MFTMLYLNCFVVLGRGRGEERGQGAVEARELSGQGRGGGRALSGCRWGHSFLNRTGDRTGEAVGSMVQWSNRSEPVEPPVC
jgi:hypothetical protein